MSTTDQTELRERVIHAVEQAWFDADRALDVDTLVVLMADAILPLIEQAVSERTAALAIRVSELETQVRLDSALIEGRDNRFRWAEAERQQAEAKLDALYEHIAQTEADQAIKAAAISRLEAQREALRAALEHAKERADLYEQWKRDAREGRMHTASPPDKASLLQEVVEIAVAALAAQPAEAQERREAERVVIDAAQEFYRLREDIEHAADALMLTDEQIEACNAAYESLGAALARLDAERGGGDGFR